VHAAPDAVHLDELDAADVSRHDKTENERYW
jgi:hypothetical protein